tara:strand:+ start:330 stop:1892 length:1563 start_codon:yes stop_codon:yes gene_type:complete
MELSKLNKLSKDKIKYYGHNCFTIESDKTILVIDPWFSSSGAFFGSWFQFPKNHHLSKELQSKINHFDQSFIFITHEHQDHYDAEFLSQVPKNTSIIVPNYRDKSFRDECLTLGCPVIELKDGTNFKLEESFYIRLYSTDVGINHDTAILASLDGVNFFNQNDCKCFDRLHEIDEKIHFYSVQFSGASWHPSNFIFSERKKKIVAGKKVQNKLNNVLSGIQELNPDYYLPAAGPAIFPFLDNSLSYGIDNVFIHQNTLNNFLLNKTSTKNLFLRPGQLISEGSDTPIQPPNANDLKDYRHGLKDVWKSLDVNFDLKKLLNEINLRFKEIIDLEIKQTPILIFNYSEVFDSHDFNNTTKIFIDIANKKVLDTFEYDSPYEEIIADRRYFALMHSGARWQNIYLSLRAKVLRKPDIFTNAINIFLYSDLPNIRDNFIETFKISNERIDVQNKQGDIYEIDRFCPHQGADLCNATIDKDNNLICPRHGWKFSLGNEGRAINSLETINSRKLKLIEKMNPTTEE